MDDSGLDQYLAEISQQPLLSAEEERHLLQLVQDAKEERARRHPNAAVLVQGAAAFNRLVELNLRLVVKIAKRSLRPGVDFKDLIQEGNIGLMTAVERFDLKRGTRFSTLATWWIFQAVSRYIDNQARTIRLPVHFGMKVRRLLRTSHELYQELQKEPTLPQLAERLQMTLEAVEELLCHVEGEVSLDAALVQTDSELFLADLIADDTQPSPMEQAEYQLMHHAIEEMLSSALTSREAQIIRARFGFENRPDQTLLEVSKGLHITRERVRQIEAQALNKLRRHEFRHLQEFLH